MARCSGPKGPTPATPPFDRSQGLRSLRLRSRPPKRATGTFRRPRPLATKGGDARHQLASPPSVAHLAAPLGRHSVVLTLRRCKMIPLHGIILPAARGDGPRPSALPPGARRTAPGSLPAGPIGTPLRDRSCHARAVPRALPRKSKEPAGWSGGLPKTAPRRPRA